LQQFKNQISKKLMKKIAGILVFYVLIATSCGSIDAKEKQKNSSSNREISSHSEQLQVAGIDARISGQQPLSESQSSSLPVAIDTTKIEVTGGSRLINKAEFLQKIWNYEKSSQKWVFLGERPAIIDFYADWCGPCRIASPILEEISHEFAGKIDVYKIDTQKEQELAAVFGVRGIPAFLYIPKNGLPKMTAGIARSKEDTKQMFIDNINNILNVKL
jgi:thioredoxin 1